MSDKMSIPQIRERMQALAQEQSALASRQIEIAHELEELVQHSYRRPAAKHARTQAKRVTPELAERIREFAINNPKMPNREIGRIFGVDGGRVSEALHGVRP